jgi:hypothetical protein
MRVCAWHASLVPAVCGGAAIAWRTCSSACWAWCGALRGATARTTRMHHTCIHAIAATHDRRCSCGRNCACVQRAQMHCDHLPHLQQGAPWAWLLEQHSLALHGGGALRCRKAHTSPRRQLRARYRRGVDCWSGPFQGIVKGFVRGFVSCDANTGLCRPQHAFTLCHTQIRSSRFQEMRVMFVCCWPLCDCCHQPHRCTGR